MPAIFSNELKAILVLEDITEEGVSVPQSNCFTVQHFHYRVERPRDADGVPFGTDQPAYLEFTVRISADDSGKTFFERMVSPENHPYSFLFNATFNAARRLSQYEDALVATGYMIETEEAYDKEPLRQGSQEQMLIRARLLLSNLVYLGQENDLKLTITND